MVFFTCNHCGESLKKAAVEKHYSFKSCKQPHSLVFFTAYKSKLLTKLFHSLHLGRNAPIFLTCVDCLKDFKEEEYAAHTKVLVQFIL